MKRACLILGFVTGIVFSSRPSDAQYIADFQTNIISAVTSNWTGDYLVGSNTLADVLLIQSSGVLSNGAGYLGYEASSSNNNVVVTGNGTFWINDGGLIIGYSSLGNSLVISNGGRVFDTSGSAGGWNYFSGSRSSNNCVLVTDSGSVWSNRYGVFVGYHGDANSLVVSNGGQVVSGEGSVGLGSSNSAIVTGSDSVWSNGNEIIVSYDGPGNSLMVSDGGKVVSGSGYIGYNGSSSNNVVVITGTGSVWSNRGDLIFSYYYGRNNSLEVRDGGGVFNGNAYLGGSSVGGWNNSALVTGAGSVWSNRNDLLIGYYSSLNSNSVIIGDGGRVFSNLGRINSSYNTVLVTGPDSVWNNGTLSVERNENRLIITDGGALYNTYGYIGSNTSATGNSVIVTGSGSVWSNSSALYIGYSGLGNSLVISNGGRVCVGYDWRAVVPAPSYVGYSPSSSNNSVLVTGSGSIWTNGADLYVGTSGVCNRLVISNGGRVIDRWGLVGYNRASSNNSVLVSGAGSVWNNTGTLTIGSSGASNSLVIGDGGTVYCIRALVGSNTTSTGNSVLVTDPGSVLTNSGTVSIGGFNGAGNSLVISNGGKVVSQYGDLGYGSTASNNSALVTDTGSVWNNRNGLLVGRYGAGNSLVISNGGLVVASGTTDVGYDFSSSSNSVRVVSDAIWRNNILDVGNLGSSNSLFVAGGTVFATNVVIGLASIDCDNLIQMDSGSIVVTNAAHNGTFEVRQGRLTLNGGTLHVDRFVMTNSCAQFVRTGGTLIYGTAVLDPTRDDDGDGMPNGWEQSHGLDPLNPADANADNDGDGMSNLQEFEAGTDPTNSASAFRIIEIWPEDDDMFLTWTAVGGKWYILQTATGFTGSFSNDFVDLDAAFYARGTGETEISVLHLGAATNAPVRFYRVRLVP